jgi:hypothetical protein
MLASVRINEISQTDPAGPYVRDRRGRVASNTAAP